jgi:hypothetical protein
VGSSYVLHVMVEAEDMGKVEAEAEKRLVETEIATKAEGRFRFLPHNPATFHLEPLNTFTSSKHVISLFCNHFY